MRDRSYAIALVVILAVCCLGFYVAVSGYLNSRPPSASTTAIARPPAATLVGSSATTNAPPTQTPVTVSATYTATVTATVPPPDSPLGFFQTITPITTDVGTPAATASPTKSLPTLPPTAPPPTVAPAQSCAAFPFCPVGGPPDAQLAPTGDPCPRNYIWGRIVDLAHNGLPDMRVQWKGPLGSTDVVVSKSRPDPPGIYNVLSPPPGGSWVLWLVDASGKALSPQITLVAPKPYSGSGNCPNRVDFVQQR